MCFLFSKPFWRIILKTATYLILQKPGFSNENLVILKNPKKRGFRKLRVYIYRFKPLLMPLLRFWKRDLSLLGVIKALAVTVRQSKISSRVCSRFRPHGGPLLPPPAPRRARRPPGPVLTKVQGAKGRKTYRAFSGLLHQDVLGALGLCADNSTGCELEKHVRRLVGSLPWGFALSILQTKWSCVSKIDSSTSLQGSCLAHCCSVSLLSWSPKLASSRLAFRLSNTGFAKSIHIYNAVLCGLAP